MSSCREDFPIGIGILEEPTSTGPGLLAAAAMCAAMEAVARRGLETPAGPTTSQLLVKHTILATISCGGFDQAAAGEALDERSIRCLVRTCERIAVREGGKVAFVIIMRGRMLAASISTVRENTMVFREGELNVRA